MMNNMFLSFPNCFLDVGMTPRQKNRYLNKTSYLIGFSLIFILILTHINSQAATIDIISKNLSHRVLVLDTIETRLKLMIGFSITGDLPSGPRGTSASAQLSRDGSELASFSVPKLDHLGGNLVFYLPYNVAPGDYNLSIELTDISSATSIATKNYTVESIETISARETSSGDNWMQPPSIPLNNPPDENLNAVATPGDNERGYILWHRNPFRYVYPNSVPNQSDVISNVSVRIAKNEYEPITFSLYALKALGNVSVSVSDIIGEAGPSPDIHKILIVKTVPRVQSRQSPESGYELRPRLLEEGTSVSLSAGQSQRFWLTLHAAQETGPGQYSGTIIITTDLGQAEIPLSVEILPFALLERTDKEYGFEMTYVFQEMTAQDLTEHEREKIYQNGLKYYRSFRDHGLTTIIPHSPFVFRRLPDGNPDLRDLKAALDAFIEVGFTGPFIYYCGHLVQSSKPGWAGSTLGYDSNYHPLLMKEIIAYARQHFPKINSLDIYWMPGDEVQHDAGDPDRMQIAEELLTSIWEVNEKSAISVWENVSWPVDIKFGDPQPLNGEHWHYPNGSTTLIDDAESMRRTFGLYHIKSHYVGIAPWTFQASENAAGDPYTDLDARVRPEVMVAYPGMDGPMLTPEYEAMREGIDDGKYAYVLETRIEYSKNSPDPMLQNYGIQAETAYQAILNNIETATLEEMDQNRKTMVDWIIQIGSTTTGDIDDNNEVNLTDAILTLKILTDLQIESAIILQNSLSQNYIGIEDTIYILQLVSGQRE